MRTQEEDKIKLYANEQYVILDTYKKDCIDKVIFYFINFQLDKMDYLLEKTVLTPKFLVKIPKIFSYFFQNF